jgi:cytochrome d ubiquinol oxidase subunit I
MDPVVLSRIQFGFTTAYHYLFPPFTMGLALLLVIVKTMALLRHDELANQAVRFWSRLCAMTFVMGARAGCRARHSQYRGLKGATLAAWFCRGG